MWQNSLLQLTSDKGSRSRTTSPTRICPAGLPRRMPGEQLRQGEVSAAGLRVWLEAGQREPIIFRANQALLAQLTTTQQTIFWRQVDGGHDALCWRGGLTAGLIQLWQPLLSHP